MRAKRDDFETEISLFRYARLTEPPKVRNVFILLLSLFKKVNVAFSVFWIGFLGSSKIKKKKVFLCCFVKFVLTTPIFHFYCYHIICYVQTIKR